MDCQLCGKDLSAISILMRESHYEQHFLEEPQASHISSPNTSNLSLKKINRREKWRNNPIVGFLGAESKDSDPFWHSSSAASLPANFTPGFIPLLRKTLMKSHSQGKTTRATLCFEHTVHIAASWDAGWGCGYRNFMMVCTALVDQQTQPAYARLLNEGIEPGVRNLQRAMEDAWASGYDPEGASQLGSIVGSHKWIGTSDLFTVFSHRGIPSELVDFDFTLSKSNQSLTDWIINYFSTKPTATNVNTALIGASPVIITDKMPIVLQQKGHSRTVVGYEIHKSGDINLLVFDTSRRIPKSVRSAALEETGRVIRNSDGPDTRRRKISNAKEVSAKGPTCSEIFKIFRLDVKKLSQTAKYQILHFPLTSPLTQAEKDRRKVVQSTKVV